MPAYKPLSLPLRQHVKPAKGSFVLPKADLVFSGLLEASLRQAVLQPFTPTIMTSAGLHSRVSVQKVAPVVRDVFHLRNQQLLRIKDQPGELLNKLAKYCYPGLVEFPDLPLRACKARIFCPFCWGREVVADLCRRILAMLYYYG